MNQIDETNQIVKLQGLTPFHVMAMAGRQKEL
jgi:hypothetical protein